MSKEVEQSSNSLFKEIFHLVSEARSYLAQTANQTITLLYWKIGNTINNNLLNNQRAEYGKQIVSELATQLQNQFGNP